MVSQLRVLQATLAFCCVISRNVHIGASSSSVEQRIPSRDIEKIAEYLIKGEGRGKAYAWVANITDTFGPRIIGSENLAAAVDFVQHKARAARFQKVRKSVEPNLPYWVRGDEEAVLLKPRFHVLSILGLGGTNPTPNEGIRAKVVVVRNYTELMDLGSRNPDAIKGKILVFNQPWKSYFISKNYRTKGAEGAEKFGALAVLVRSITPFSIRSPHTGFGSPRARIPQASISVEEAETMWRMQENGEELEIFLRITSHFQGITESWDSAFEITGTELPHEIVLISGHLDSWDVGEGAMDDAGGCGIMWQALSAIQALGLKPKRTIRVVFWGAEENGASGPTYYRNTRDEKFVFVAESDEGAFKPATQNAFLELSNPNTTIEGLFPADIISAVRAILEPYGLTFEIKPIRGGDGDVSPWENGPDKVPGIFYINGDRDEYYFTYHHTKADYVTIFRPEDLDYSSAMYAAIGYAFANV